LIIKKINQVNPENHFNIGIFLQKTLLLMETIQLALSDDAIQKCWTAFKELYPQLKKSDFLFQIRKLQIDAGYTLVFIEKEGEAVAFLGFRISEDLAHGKYLLVNEVYVREQQAQSHFAEELLDWTIEYAKTKRCAHIFIDLDSAKHPHKGLLEGRGFKTISQRFGLA